MGTIWITCPRTGKPISTGVRISATELEALATLTGTVTRCIFCAESHRWSKDDAELRDDATGATSVEFVMMARNLADSEALRSFVVQDTRVIESAALVADEPGWIIRVQGELRADHLRAIAAAASRGVAVRFALRAGATGEWVPRTQAVIDIVNLELDTSHDLGELDDSHDPV